MNKSNQVFLQLAFELLQNTQHWQEASVSSNTAITAADRCWGPAESWNKQVVAVLQPPKTLKQKICSQNRSISGQRCNNDMALTVVVCWDKKHQVCMPKVMAGHAGPIYDSIHHEAQAQSRTSCLGWSDRSTAALLCRTDTFQQLIKHGVTVACSGH